MIMVVQHPNGDPKDMKNMVGALKASLQPSILQTACPLRVSESRRFLNNNKRVRRDGAFYLFTLRLVPVFPVFVVNLVMGLTSIRALVFYVVSQVGMLSGTLVCVNAGTQLARIESLQGILSPSLLLSFALLDLFPLIAKKGVSMIKSRRVYATWKKPKKYDYNMVVM
jgi:uncharacterized membrane protein YdjX (TVP38/TMEM64 family)